MKIYETPAAEIMEVYSEGVFCQSDAFGDPDGSFEEWEEEDFGWE